MLSTAGLGKSRPVIRLDASKIMAGKISCRQGFAMFRLEHRRGRRRAAIFGIS
jgi:hypothetical protein